MQTRKCSSVASNFFIKTKKDYLKGSVAILHSPKTEVVVVDLEIQL